MSLVSQIFSIAPFRARSLQCLRLKRVIKCYLVPNALESICRGRLLDESKGRYHSHSKSRSGFSRPSRSQRGRGYNLFLRISVLIIFETSIPLNRRLRNSPFPESSPKGATSIQSGNKCSTNMGPTCACFRVHWGSHCNTRRGSSSFKSKNTPVATDLTFWFYSQPDFEPLPPSDFVSCFVLSFAFHL